MCGAALRLAPLGQGCARSGLLVSDGDELVGLVDWRRSGHLEQCLRGARTGGGDYGGAELAGGEAVGELDRVADLVGAE